MKERRHGHNKCKLSPLISQMAIISSQFSAQQQHIDDLKSQITLVSDLKTIHNESVIHANNGVVGYSVEKTESVTEDKVDDKDLHKGEDNKEVEGEEEGDKEKDTNHMQEIEENDVRTK